MGRDSKLRFLQLLYCLGWAYLLPIQEELLSHRRLLLLLHAVFLRFLLFQLFLILLLNEDAINFGLERGRRHLHIVFAIELFGRLRKLLKLALLQEVKNPGPSLLEHPVLNVGGPASSKIFLHFLHSLLVSFLLLILNPLDHLSLL